MNVSQTVQKFKIDLLRKMPFYGNIAANLRFIEDKSVQTACTNGLDVLYNPDYFKKLAVGEINFILMHEVFHIILLHCKRGKGRDPFVWNLACDMIVNRMLINAFCYGGSKTFGMQFQKPADGVFENVSVSDTAENIYSQLVAKGRIENVQGKKRVFTVSGKKSFNEEGSKDLIYGQSGTGAEPTVDPEQAITLILRDAVSKSRGSLSGIYIPDRILSLTQSKRLNWRSMFKNMLSDRISDEASYATPERKYIHMELIIPGLGTREEKLEEVWAFVDSSGSVGLNEMNEFLTQLHRIISEFSCTLNICYWDTRVTDVYRNIRKKEEIFKCTPKHSGGTDINCVYRWLAENKVRPDVMLVLTDGYFGTLSSDHCPGGLSSNTILVLSTNIPDSADLRRVGRIARLH